MFTGIFIGDWDKFSTGIGTIWTSLWEGVKETITNIGGGIVTLIAGWTSTVVGKFEDLKKTVIGSSIVPEMMNDIKAEFQRLNSDAGLTPVGTRLGAIVTEFGTTKTTTLATVTTMVNDVGTKFNDMASSLVTKIATGEGSLQERLGAAFSSIKDSILNVASSEVIGELNKALDSVISRTPGLERLGGVFGGSTPSVPGTPNVPGVPGGGGGGGAGGFLSGNLFGNFLSLGSLVTDVFSFLQDRRQTRTQGMIEENTRFSQILQAQNIQVLFRLLDEVSFGAATKANEQARDTLVSLNNFLVPKLDSLLGEVAFGSNVKANERSADFLAQLVSNSNSLGTEMAEAIRELEAPAERRAPSRSRSAASTISDAAASARVPARSRAISEAVEQIFAPTRSRSAASRIVAAVEQIRDAVRAPGRSRSVIQLDSRVIAEVVGDRLASGLAGA